MTSKREYKEAVRKVTRRIREGTKTAETYGTGLCTEKVLVATFDLMTIDQLEQLRYLLTQKIKQKRLYKEINNQND